MARKKKYNREEVLDEMQKAFLKRGYEATSLDDLEKATGMLRGSLYSAFGSKKGMFEETLKNSIERNLFDENTINMLLIALLELSHRDDQINSIIQQEFKKHPDVNFSLLLGEQLLKRAKLRRMKIMANKVNIKDDLLIVEPVGLDKVWGVQGIMTIPLKNIKGATIDREIINQSKGIRTPGLNTGSKYSGTFKVDGDKNYWNVSKGETPVVIQLANEKYNRLILGIEEAKKFVDSLNNKI